MCISLAFSFRENKKHWFGREAYGYQNWFFYIFCKFFYIYGLYLAMKPIYPRYECRYELRVFSPAWREWTSSLSRSCKNCTDLQSELLWGYLPNFSDALASEISSYLLWAFEKIAFLRFAMGLFSPTHAFSGGFWQISLKRSVYVNFFRFWV